MAERDTVGTGKLAERVRGLLRGEYDLPRVRRYLTETGEDLFERAKTARLRRQSPPEDDTPLFFIVGSGRSGTNWLMRTLDTHPEILCTGEGRFFGRHMRHERLIEMQTTEHMPDKLQPSSLYNALADSEYLRYWIERSIWSRDGDSEEHVRNLTRLAVNYFLTQKLSKTGKRMVGDKTPLESPEVVREISEICPEARVIHIIRDGRDQAVSLLHFLWNRSIDQGGVYKMEPEEQDKRDRYREDPQKFLESGESIFTDERLRRSAKAWSTRVGTASRYGSRLLGSNYTEVRYEDLLARPEKEFARLFEFLDARADEKLVERCVKRTAFERRTGGRKRGEEDLDSGVRKGIAGDWNNVFTERDRTIFKEAAGDLRVKLGYERDGDW